jgi:hypothetical protein
VNVTTALCGEPAFWTAVNISVRRGDLLPLGVFADFLDDHCDPRAAPLRWCFNEGRVPLSYPSPGRGVLWGWCIDYRGTTSMPWWIQPDLFFKVRGYRYWLAAAPAASGQQQYRGQRQYRLVRGGADAAYKRLADAWLAPDLTLTGAAP